MSDILLDYMKRFDITFDKAEKRRLVPTENGTRTAAKEMIGESIIKHYKLFDILFPDNLGYKKITNKKLQKAGVDYEIYLDNNETIYIDLKSCVGFDYNMKIEDFDTIEPTDDLLNRKGVPLEITQNGSFTFTKDKLTDYLLFIICDKDGIAYINMDYTSARNACLKHKDYYEIDREKHIAHLAKHYPYKRYTSNNGSGLYIKYPIFAKLLDSFEDNTTN